MLAVATEQLIRAHTREQYLDAGFPGRLAHQDGVDGRRIANRLVKNINNPRQHVDDVGIDLDLVQLDSEMCRHLARVHSIVRHRLESLILRAEGNGVRLNGRFAVRGQCGNKAGVETAAQE
jgi:hypothetical protein